MKRKTIGVFLGCLVVVSGCASAPPAKSLVALQADLAALSHKFELARRENYRLKSELTLFRKSKNIDSTHFVEASEGSAAILQKDIAENVVGLAYTERGLVVTVLAEKLFVSGSNALSDEGREFLERLSLVFTEQFPRNFIYIEGHTDNQSLAVFEWKSDWDFSFARALGVLKFFTETKKMDPLRFSAAGFGQYRPRDTNETKEGRRLNRRIEITIAPEQLKRTASQKARDYYGNE